MILQLKPLKMLKFNIFFYLKQIVSLTELMAGIKAEPKTCQLFQLMCWPQGHKVPTSTNALVELMNMVERWRQRSNLGPVLVISPLVLLLESVETKF